MIVASKSVVLAPIMSALVKSEDMLGPNRVWRAVNALQEKFLNEFFSKKGELAGFSKEELRSWIGDNAAKLNAILEEEGFKIRLEEFFKNEFGVVSILDVMVEWIKEGAITEIKAGGGIYPAVSMGSFAVSGDEPNVVVITIFEAYNSPAHPNPVVCVHTKSGDKVFMTVAEKEVGGFELIDVINGIRNSGLDYADNYKILEFPMIDYDEVVDISWLIGMETTDARGMNWYISQAKGQTKFKMNHKGARLKSSVAVGMAAFSMNLPEVLMIDKPFLLWIERDGLTIPVQYSYYDTEHWKDPGSLDM